MGNTISNRFENNNCLICQEKIGSQQWCKCVRCNVILHDLCEKKNRGEKHYTECPQCNRIGSIGFLYK